MKTTLQFLIEIVITVALLRVGELYSTSNIWIITICLIAVHLLITVLLKAISYKGKKSVYSDIDSPAPINTYNTIVNEDVDITPERDFGDIDIN